MHFRQTFYFAKRVPLKFGNKIVENKIWQILDVPLIHSITKSHGSRGPACNESPGGALLYKGAGIFPC